MKRVLFLLLFLFGFLGLAIVSQPWWPYLSVQDKIDPITLSDNYDPNAKVGIFNNKEVIVPQGQPQILGETFTLNNNPNKYIEVDLTLQKVYAYENGQRIKEYTISSGKWGRTPTGTFKIWTKIRSQKMSGGSKLTKDYYYLPNVPYIMFFYNDKYPKNIGFSLHGTYWHDNFGVPMSHGCINMRTADAAEIFNWAEVETEVRIYGKYQYGTTTMNL